MAGISDPATYEAWYHSPRGSWIADREYRLLNDLIRPAPGESLLDVGCGTGHFSRRFDQDGLCVTGLDPDEDALRFARAQGGDIRYLQGNACSLPFPDRSFDHVAAITSLCFVDDPLLALNEMWRVTRRTLFLGLLNRHSLLHYKKRNRGGYRSARWDGGSEIVTDWLPNLRPMPVTTTLRTAVFFPQAGSMVRLIEEHLSTQLPWGSFLAVCAKKQLTRM